MKIATYNVWHGLSGSGLARFGELEPAGRKLRRLELQIKSLSSLELDVLFLQEVNPLMSGSQFYANALGLSEIHQLDQVGVEILGFGFPANLKTGLCTLADYNYRQKKTGGFRLSGPRLGFLSEKFSFQYAEFRYALVSRIFDGDKSILLVNVHLHHAPGLSSRMSHELNRLVESDQVRSDLAMRVRADMNSAVERRRSEILKVTELIETHSGVGEPVIVAGDFNTSGPELQSLEKLDLVNVTFDRVKGPTWSPDENHENHAFSSGLELPISDQGDSSLRDFIKRCIHTPERLDHIFVSRNHAAKVKDARRICDESEGGLFGSDHFGLMVEFG
jgi:endonuclease/exonuclease/phosphatase family metal-dependent hydrolase